jgi:hypothetical protein
LTSILLFKNWLSDLIWHTCVDFWQRGWFHKALQQNGKKVAALSTNNFQAPGMVQNSEAQTLSYYRGDEPQRDAAQPQQRDTQPLEPAGSEPPLSVLIPDTESELPEVVAAAVAVDGTGFGSPLPVHFREANTASGLESEAAMDNQPFHQMQHPTLMQCGNLQSAATLPRCLSLHDSLKMKSFSFWLDLVYVCTQSILANFPDLLCKHPAFFLI